MAKFKSGLHKEIKSIFGGVPISPDKNVQQPAQPTVPAFMKEHNDSGYQTPQTPQIPKPVAAAQPTPKQAAPAPAIPNIQPDRARKPEAASGHSTGIWQQIKVKLFGDNTDGNPGKQKVMAMLIPILIIILIIAFNWALSTPQSGVIIPGSPASAQAASVGS